MKIYIDSEYHCHTTNIDNICREAEVPFFDGKGKTFVEGYCYDDSEGYVKRYPWKPYNELAAAQAQYEADLAAAAAAYQEGVNSAYDE